MFKRFSREVCSKNGKSRNDLLILQYFPRVLSRTWCRNNGPKCPNGKRDSREGWKRLAGRNRGFSSEGKKLIFRGGDPRLRTNPLFISPHGETHPSRVSRLVTTFPVSLCASVPSFVLARSPLPSARPFSTLPRLVPRLLSITVFRDSQFTRVGRRKEEKEKKTGATRHVSPSPVLFTPETRHPSPGIPRTRVIIEPRIATRLRRGSSSDFCLRSRQIGFKGRLPMRHCLFSPVARVTF